MVTITSGIERFVNDAGAQSARDTSAPENCLELNYHPFPKQQQFHGSPAKYRLFGGAAGPGKSKALLMEAIVQAHEHPGANTLLLRRTFPELEQSLLLYFRRDVPRELYKDFQESKHVVTWKNGSTTRFGYCQRESDVYQYQGAEFLFIGIDELTLFTLRQWQFLTSRNRCPIPGSFPCMAGATNPGNIGHAWVKSLWIDREAPAGMERPESYDPADYDFISARVFDNPIYAADENYLKTLRALPSHLRRAFLDGDWNVFAGQYFDRFDATRHVVRGEEIEWKPWWPRWISIDWGFEHPAAVYWHAALPAGRNVAQVFRPEGSAENDRTRILASEEASYINAPRNVAQVFRPEGSADATPRVVTYREFVTRHTSPRDLAREIIDRSLSTSCHSESAAADEESAVRFCSQRTQQIPRRPNTGLTRDDNDDREACERIDTIYLSPDAFARRTDEASIAEQMGDVFAAAGFPRPIPADNDRVGGWMLMYQMLDAGEWLMTDNCIELIRTLPNLVRDPVRIEDIEKMDGDDPGDAARYGLKSRYGARSPSLHAPLAQRLAALVTSADPTIRAIQARKAQFDESRRSRPVSFLHRRR